MAYFTRSSPSSVGKSVVAGYFRGMQLSQEYQALVDFFAAHSLPSGPQHINPYSTYLNLQGAVYNRLQQLHSNVEATQKSAALMLTEVKDWLEKQT